MAFSNFSPQGDGNEGVFARLEFLSQSAFSNFSPQGDGNRSTRRRRRYASSFFKLFPARGWKPRTGRPSVSVSVLFQTFPRKGMETGSFNLLLRTALQEVFFKLFPARGWKPRYHLWSTVRAVPAAIHLFQTFPRKGMETQSSISSSASISFFKLFPARGWKQRGLVACFLESRDHLFQTFPRKGMETIWSPIYKGHTCPLYFFKLFPARGWKRYKVYSCDYP